MKYTNSSSQSIDLRHCCVLNDCCRRQLLLHTSTIAINIDDYHRLLLTSTIATHIDDCQSLPHRRLSSIAAIAIDYCLHRRLPTIAAPSTIATHIDDYHRLLRLPTIANDFCLINDCCHDRRLPTIHRRSLPTSTIAINCCPHRRLLLHRRILTITALSTITAPIDDCWPLLRPQ